jgi:hypothetical protein
LSFFILARSLFDHTFGGLASQSSKLRSICVSWYNSCSSFDPFLFSIQISHFL